MRSQLEISHSLNAVASRIGLAIVTLFVAAILVGCTTTGSFCDVAKLCQKVIEYMQYYRRDYGSALDCYGRIDKAADERSCRLGDIPVHQAEAQSRDKDRRHLSVF